MVNMVKCAVCGMEFKDNHTYRKGNKFCCRDHFRQYKKIHGCGNRGKKWEETYSPETLKFMKERATKKDKEHFNYGKKRNDLLIRNLINNPKRTKEANLKIKNALLDDPQKTIKLLLERIGADEKYAYQRKAYEKYGRKCSICGKTDGQIDTHHVDGNHKNNKIENLQVLCASCHGKLHKRLRSGLYKQTTRFK